jgi:putative acetyltransferase
LHPRYFLLRFGPTRLGLTPHPGSDRLRAPGTKHVRVPAHLPLAKGRHPGHILRTLQARAPQGRQAKGFPPTDHVAPIQMAARAMLGKEMAPGLHHRQRGSGGGRALRGGWLGFRPQSRPGPKQQPTQNKGDDQQQTTAQVLGHRIARAIPIQATGSSQPIAAWDTDPRPTIGPSAGEIRFPMVLRPLLPADWAQVEEVYADAVRTLAAPLYRPRQIDAWARHPVLNPDVREALGRGHGMVGCAPEDPASVEAFALLDPPDRLALLYCRGRSSRRGLATQLVRCLEQHARADGQSYLRTEASRLSRPLLERLGWTVDGQEEILFAGEPFVRWRMSTVLV